MMVWAVSLLTRGASPPPSNCRALNPWYSEFDRFRVLADCRNLPVLYPQGEHTTQARKLFRRKPAITGFDKLFTPTLKSSRDVEQSMGSALHLYFYKLQPAQG